MFATKMALVSYTVGIWLKGAWSYFTKFSSLFHLKNHHSKDVKDLSQFQWKSAHAPKKELPKDFL